MNLLKIFLTALVAVCSFWGCTPSHTRVSTAEKGPWNENVQEEVKDMTEAGYTYPAPAGTPEDSHLFFTRHKPQIKTVQLWLESSKKITHKIRDYLKEIWPDRGSETSQMPPGERLIGKWYGIDHAFDSAIVFTFTANGEFAFQTRDKTNTGKFVVKQDPLHMQITFTGPGMPDRYNTVFEFIDDYALLLKKKDRDLILFKKS